MDATKNSANLIIDNTLTLHKEKVLISLRRKRKLQNYPQSALGQVSAKSTHEQTSLNAPSAKQDSFSMARTNSPQREAMHHISAIVSYRMLA